MALITKSDLWDFWDKKVTPDEKKGFRRSFGLHPIEMKSRTELFKYSTPYPFNSSRGLWSPWWNLRNAQNILLNNGRLHLCPGLGEHLSRADFPGGNPVRLARVRSAVKHELERPANPLFGAVDGQCLGDVRSERRAIGLNH